MTTNPTAAQARAWSHRDTGGRFAEHSHPEAADFTPPTSTDGDAPERRVYTTRDDAITYELEPALGEWGGDFDIEELADEVFEWHTVTQELPDGSTAERVDQSGFRWKDEYAAPDSAAFWEAAARHDATSDTYEPPAVVAANVPVWGTAEDAYDNTVAERLGADASAYDRETLTAAFLEPVEGGGWRLKPKFSSGARGGQARFDKELANHNPTNGVPLPLGDIEGGVQQAHLSIDETYEDDDPEGYWDAKESLGDWMDQAVKYADHHGIPLSGRDEWLDHENTQAEAELSGDDETIGDCRVHKGDLVGAALDEIRTHEYSKTHRMMPGSHERRAGAECVCGAGWDRWNDQCVRVPHRTGAQQ